MPTDLLDAKAVKSPLWWLRRHVPASVPSQYAPYHRQLVELPEPGESQLRAVFRGAAKTTVVRGMLAHHAGHRRVRGILLIAATFRDCKNHRQALERSAKLAGYPCHSDSDLEMVVINRVPIWTRSPGGAVRGINWTDPYTGDVIRPDLCVIDDLETRASASSAKGDTKKWDKQGQTEKLQTWLFSDALATGDPGHPMRTIMLGTPITPVSLVAKAMRKEPPFDKWLEPLIVPYEVDGEPTWPDNYDPTLRARMPEITMATEYDMQPLPPGTLLFPPERTQWVDLPANPRWPVVIGVDPAGDGDDATAAVAVARVPRGLHVVDVLHWSGSMDEAPAECGAFVRRVSGHGWNIQGVTVEANKGAWRFFARDLANDLGGQPAVQTEPPVGSKVERALPLTVWHKAHAVSAAASLASGPFDVEFHSFTQSGVTVTGHDDLVDALVWAAAPLTNGWQHQPSELAHSGAAS